MKEILIVPHNITIYIMCHHQPLVLSYWSNLYKMIYMYICTSQLSGDIGCPLLNITVNFDFFMDFYFQTKGKLIVVGSVHMFHDQYIDKEENSKILVCI